MTTRDIFYVIAAIVGWLITFGGIIWYLASWKGEVELKLSELRGHLDTQDVVLADISDRMKRVSERMVVLVDEIHEIDKRVVVTETKCEMCQNEEGG